MHAWLEDLSKSIQSRNLLSDNEIVLVAVSGGLDSMVLMHALHHLRPKHGWRLVIAHFNHQLRGAESDEDERFVVSEAEQLGLSALTGRGDVRRMALTNKLSLEMAARSLRHRFLAEAAQKAGAQSIALGHHAGDQVELFFLRLMRGGGKTGMSWRNHSPASNSIFLVRPFLDVPKSYLEKYARDQGIPFREDATNSHWDIPRNRVRLDLIPILKNRYQSDIETHILRFMAISSAESEYAGEAAREWLQNNQTRLPFHSLPVAVQRQVVLRQLINLSLEPDFDLVESLRLKPEIRISQGADRWILRKESGQVVFDRRRDCSFHAEAIELDIAIPGETVFGHLHIQWRAIEGIELEAVKRRFSGVKEGVDGEQSTLVKRVQLGEEVFDADKIGSKICLRHWQAGDRFQPIGMRQPVKLQDLLVNAKVPANERRSRIAGVSRQADALFFMEGLRISDLFKLDKDSVRGLTWRWRQGQSPQGV
jgi:tRNA(Ile)-lysidine synthase